MFLKVNKQERTPGDRFTTTKARFPYNRYGCSDSGDRSKNLTQRAQQSYGNRELSDRSDRCDYYDCSVHGFHMIAAIAIFE